ncbi:MAG: hypothetical protein IPJ94_10000 [Chloroflexi bacterium]|nr:hypothetical protein [Chloroflexota bacterium]
MSTDLSCSTKAVLQGYSWRWSCEVVNFYAKTQLGLADFRVRSYEAVDGDMVVVHLAWAYVNSGLTVNVRAKYRLTATSFGSIETNMRLTG